MASPYQVPKQKVPAQIFAPGLGKERVQLFLSDRAETHGGRERPSDLVNGPRDFVVAQDANGQAMFLQRDSIAILAVLLEHERGKDLAPADSLAEDLDTEVRLAITLDNGTRVEGIVRYQLPQYSSRVQDFLNKEERFIPLEQGEKLLLVNKRRIARIVPL